MPSKVLACRNPRMSATIHSWSGSRSRHNAIRDGELSTPVTRIPWVTTLHATGIPPPHPRPRTLAPLGSKAMKRSCHFLSFQPPHLRSASHFGSVTLVVGDYLIGDVNHSAELGSLPGAGKGSTVFERGRRSDTGTVLPLVWGGFCQGGAASVLSISRP